MLLTHYLLCITHIGPLQFHSFLAPGGTKSRFKMASPFLTTKKPAEIVSMVPQRRPMVPTWGPKGSPRPPKGLPKVAQNHQKMWTCLQGHPQRATRSPKVPQIDENSKKSVVKTYPHQFDTNHGRNTLQKKLFKTAPSNPVAKNIL